MVLQAIKEKPGLEYPALARKCYKVRNLRGVLVVLEKKGLVRVERVATHQRYYLSEGVSVSSSSLALASASTSPARS